MRDLNLNELDMVYGAGRSKGSSRGSSSGWGCSPTPPSCGGSKGTKKTKKTKKSKKSKGTKRSRGC
ncbi:hypothetical protein [Novosphingobium sp.]|uniref:hypothetical protein n=1 Tax=Novosphingobium sp. TaxID=1874826 RepID=UPI002611A527|nr:hypothetical protein [Novosphingobium sp.]